MLMAKPLYMEYFVEDDWDLDQAQCEYPFPPFGAESFIIMYIQNNLASQQEYSSSTSSICTSSYSVFLLPFDEFSLDILNYNYK